MPQVIAICVLLFWVAVGVYLYRADPSNERSWSGNKKSFLIGVIVYSTAITFCATGLATIIAGLLLVAFGVVK